MTLHTAELISIGDELLIGQTLNTNAQWLGQKLDSIGIKPAYCSTIGDNKQDILDAFQTAEARADIVFITGGLGPTKDDITKKVLCQYFDTELKMDSQRLIELQDFFSSRGREMNELNKLQAMTPKNCTPITNTVGTANGMWFEKEDTIFISMPGVPFEMKEMITSYILPKIKKQVGSEGIYHKTIKTIGIGESDLSILIENWENSLPSHIKLAYLPSYGQVKLRLSGYGKSQEELSDEVNLLFNQLRPLINQYIYTFDDTTSLEHSVAQLLSSRQLTISTAESCTGGNLAGILTSIPGSSSYFVGGVIAYSNKIKEDELNVSSETLKQHGAVSEATIIEMAQNVRLKHKTNIGIATSGIAGPGGGSEQKPVGTTWIAYSDDSQTITKKLQLTKDRGHNIKYTCIAALNLVRVSILNKD